MGFDGFVAVVGLTSMKAPPKRKGNRAEGPRSRHLRCHLNESPSEKEGKSCLMCQKTCLTDTSMKAPPKRKGNSAIRATRAAKCQTSMKAPPKRKGNLCSLCRSGRPFYTSMKAPPKRKGNLNAFGMPIYVSKATSMKAPPKRKGNVRLRQAIDECLAHLNESPSEKEGK